MLLWYRGTKAVKSVIQRTTSSDVNQNIILGMLRGFLQNLHWPMPAIWCTIQCSRTPVASKGAIAADMHYVNYCWRPRCGHFLRCCVRVMFFYCWWEHCQIHWLERVSKEKKHNINVSAKGKKGKKRLLGLLKENQMKTWIKASHT